VVDVNPQIAHASLADASFTLTTNLDSLIDIDAAIVATSTASHVAVASVLLGRGIPVLVEKPVAASRAEVAALVQLSRELGTPLMCGFVERFNPVVATCKNLIDDAILHVRTQRQSPPANHPSSSALWDLLIHDLDLVLGYFPTSPYDSLAAMTAPSGPMAGLEAVEATFRIEQALVSTMCSRQWQRKVRSLQLATESTVFELDLLRQTLTTYRNISQEQISNGTLIYRSATTVDVPFVRHAGEPLQLQLDHFLDLVDGRIDPATERATILPPHELAAAIEALCA
jgi:predicted dehydrogenase